MAKPQLSRSARALLSLDRGADRPWFLPAVGLFPLCDYLLPFLPNQLLLAGLSMTLPRRWVALAATFVVATAVGAAVIVAAIQYWGAAALSQLVSVIQDNGALSPVLEQVRAHGILVLVGIAMLPWPPRIAVLACAIAGLPPLQVGLAVLGGRIVPVAIIAGLGSNAPHLLRRLSSIGTVMREVGRRERSATVRSQLL